MACFPPPMAMFTLIQKIFVALEEEEVLAQSCSPAVPSQNGAETSQSLSGISGAALGCSSLFRLLGGSFIQPLNQRQNIHDLGKTQGGGLPGLAGIFKKVD